MLTGQTTLLQGQVQIEAHLESKVTSFSEILCGQIMMALEEQQSGSSGKALKELQAGASGKAGMEGVVGDILSIFVGSPNPRN